MMFVEMVLGWFRSAVPAQSADTPGLRYRLESKRPHFIVEGKRPFYRIENKRPHYKVD